jgi:Smr domain
MNNLIDSDSDLAFFHATPFRRGRLHVLQGREVRWRMAREYENARRDECIAFWDSHDVPISLDLHGFTAMTARRVLREFVQVCQESRLPRFGVIYGKGLVLPGEVHRTLGSYDTLEIEDYWEGHCYCDDSRGDASLWRRLELAESEEASVTELVAIESSSSGASWSPPTHAPVNPPTKPVHSSTLASDDDGGIVGTIVGLVVLFLLFRACMG